LVQVAELATLVVVELNIRMPHQHLANEQSRLSVIHLPSVISRIDEPLRAVHINGGRGPTQRAKETAA